MDGLWIDGWVDVWVNGWMRDGWMDGWMGGWMNRWMFYNNGGVDKLYSMLATYIFLGMKPCVPLVGTCLGTP